MADEPQDFRKMAEISDAIQDILNGSDTEDTPKAAENTAAVPPAPDDEDGQDAIDAGLEAAIAAELAGENPADTTFSDISSEHDEHPPETPFGAGLPDETPLSTAPAAGDFGAGPDLTQFAPEAGSEDTAADNAAALPQSDEDIATDIAANPDFDNPITLSQPDPKSAGTEPGYTPPSLSDNTLLSVRMRDVLSNLKTEQETEEANRRLFLEMQAAQDDILSKMRALNAANEEKLSLNSANIVAELDSMKHAIAETTMEIEHLAVVFDEKIKEIHALYQENFENERNRLNQYRDFIEFLLTEKR